MNRKSPLKTALITSAHGIRGQVKIRSFTSPPEAVFSLGALKDAKGRAFKISPPPLRGRIKVGINSAVSAQNNPYPGPPPKKGRGNVFIASIEGITDRNEAELLKNLELYSDNPLAAPEHDIIGLEARLPDGKAYGTVIGTYNFGAGDIVEIEKPGGKTEMLPLDGKFAEIKPGQLLIHSLDLLHNS